MILHFFKNFRVKKNLTVFAVACLGYIFSACSTSGDTIVEKPNILFISVDDLNNWIEPLEGHSQAQTPNLNDFANQSVNFTNAYCASPSCNPSRTALLCGKHPYVTGLYSNPQIWRHVLPDEVTLPEYFRQAGYWTGGAGKIFHNNMPDPRSWDDYYPSKIRHMPEYYLPVYDSTTNTKFFEKTDNEIREDDPKGITFNMPVFKNMYIAFDFEPLPYTFEQTGDYSSVQWVSDQLRKNHKKPFFLACGIYRPHLPWYVPEEFYRKFPINEVALPIIYENDLDDLPETAKKIASRGGNYHKHITQADLWKKGVQGYLASINFADQLVGELLRSLEESDYAKNTIIVIHSDHGWQLGEKQHWRKFALWENVINSVLMIKVPEGVKGLPSGSQNGSDCSRNVSLVDIFPTLTELSGLQSKEGVTGRSLVPLLLDPSSEWDYPVISTLGDNHFSIIKDHWHYINYNGIEEELYDLDKDNDEWYNLATDTSYDDIKKQLKELIPKNRHEFVKTAPIRWEDVLKGKISF
jgi:arylsulfatase A-like enzyme